MNAVIAEAMEEYKTHLEKACESARVIGKLSQENTQLKRKVAYLQQLLRKERTLK